MTIERGAAAIWFLDIFLDGETLRASNAFEEVTFDGNTYEPLGDRLLPPDEVNTSRDLKTSTVKLSFDSSRQTDNTDFLGKILDSNWKRRKIRARYAVASGYMDFSSPFIVADAVGRIDDIKDSLEPNSEPLAELEFESGSLIFLERKNQTRSPANQKSAFAGDLFFDYASRLNGVVLPWNTKRARLGRTQIEYSVDGVATREMLIGRGVTKGSFVYGATHGQQKKYWSQVFALADHRCDGIEALWINGENVLNGVTLAHGVRTALSAFNSGGTRLWVTWYDGREDQTADSYLVSETSGQSMAWTSDHRGRGVSYFIVTHLWDSDNPEDFEYEAQLRGARLYDERKDATNGGSGSHRLANPATWEFTTNSEVALRHYMLGINTSNGGAVQWFGVGADPDFLDEQSTSADRAADCDDLVDLKAGGSQKRFESNGWIRASDDHKSNVEKLAGAMVGEPVDQGGRVRIFLAEPQTPVIELLDEDLVDDEPSEVSANARARDVLNSLEGRYLDSLNKFDAVDYPPVSVAAYIQTDGESITGTWNQELETSEERAQRKALAYLNRTRRTFELTEVFGLKAKDIKSGDWITRKSVLRGFPDGKKFIADEVNKSADGSIEIVMLEVDESEKAWAKEDAQNLAQPVGDPPAGSQALPVPSITITPTAVSGSGLVIPCFEFSNADFDDFSGDGIVCEYGPSNGLAGASLGISGTPQYTILRGFAPTQILLKSFEPSSDYAFRFATKAGERFSSWSDFQESTSTPSFTVPAAGSSEFIDDQGELATKDVADWASDVTGVGKPQDDATKSRVFRQSSEPSGANVNDVWVVMSGLVAIEVRAFDGTEWLTGADLTSANIAAGIEDQGWGATASQDETDNERAGFGGNRLYHTEFTKLDDYWTNGGHGTLDSFFAFSVNGVRALRLRKTGLAVNERINITSYPQRLLISVTEGEIIALTGYIAAVNASEARLQVVFRDAAGATVSLVGLDSKTDSLYQGQPYLQQRYFGAVVVPENAVTIDYRAEAVSNGVSPTSIWLVRPQAYFSKSVNAASAEYVQGFEGDPGADVTGVNTAFAIEDQGGLATADIATYRRYDDVSTGGFDDSYVERASVTVTTDGGPVEVEWTARFDIENPLLLALQPTSARIYAAIYRDGVKISGDLENAVWFFDDAGNELPYSSNGNTLKIVDSPASGAHTYSLRFKCSQPASDGGLDAASPLGDGYLKASVYPAEANSIG